MAVKIDNKKCCVKDPDCKDCIEMCPVGALKKTKKAVVDPKVCIDCGSCVYTCKYSALSLD
jgi:NAD-dependent dihydropyrimidine dehydrogenase PreA subunit